MANFKETYQKWSTINSQLFADCKDYLKEVLLKAEDNRIEIHEDCSVSVSYDGGRHPEYDSNCFSFVHSVFLDEKGKVYLDIEDCDKYDIYNIMSSELCEVAFAVEDTLKIMNNEND